ncbi:MAG: hypothetical protein AAGB93_16350 [Planctomycetota bacterium]
MGHAICALLTALQATAPPPSEVTVLQPAAWTTVGARVPDLELPLIDGSGTFDLATLRGRKVLLVQFASW